MSKCIDLEELGIELTQQGVDSFTVKYVLHKRSGLDYPAAAKELGVCIMHALACNGRLDNRTKKEARDERAAA